MELRRTYSLGAAALAAGLLLAACSSGDEGSMGMDHDGMHGSSASSSTTLPAKASFNAVDVAFAEGMVPHHAQAVEMADDALARSRNAQVRQLATAIKAAQQHEVDQMSAWLRSWGRPVLDSSTATDHGMDHGMEGMEMSGMMSEADMARLKAASGTAFDRLWLELMIQHHEGAIAMAKQELAGGRSVAARRLAEAITAGQQREIDQMRSLLTATPA